MPRPGARIFLLAAALAGAAGCAERAKRELGLFTTLPIYWDEAVEIGALLDDAAGPHWARRLLERDYELKPLDVLGPSQRGDTLAGLDYLLLAQPRALAPAENVVLDDWVRGGGLLLLFADPMLTFSSRYPLGDRRRPHDTVLLSPILARWGLVLRFDEARPVGEQGAMLFGREVPVNLPGSLALMEPATGSGAVCRLFGDGLAADCAIGKGRALIIADAALLEAGAGESGAREAALEMLVQQAFSSR